jgi:hypothetical protein
MLTVSNNSPHHLVVPDGEDKGVALSLGPGKSSKVPKITQTLKAAEAKGLVEIQYPKGDGAKAEKKANRKSQ